MTARNSWSLGTYGCLLYYMVYLVYSSLFMDFTGRIEKMAYLCFKHIQPDHSLGAARVAELDQQSSQKVSTLWQRRCFSHEELNRYERLRPKSFFGPADLLVWYDCCQCSRDTTA